MKLRPFALAQVLSEHNVSMNFGLCRWAQYVNVLSDATGCDPGSVVAMAGELGYLACGVSPWSGPSGPSGMMLSPPSLSPLSGAASRCGRSTSLSSPP